MRERSNPAISPQALSGLKARLPPKAGFYMGRSAFSRGALVHRNLPLCPICFNVQHASNDEIKKAGGDRALVDRIRREYPSDLKIAPLVKEADKQFSKLRKARDLASSPEEREKIVKRIDEIMARVRKRYRQLQEAE